MRLLAALLTDKVGLAKNSMELAGTARCLMVMPQIPANVHAEVAIVLFGEIEEGLETTAFTTSVEGPDGELIDDGTHSHLIGRWSSADTLLHPAEPAALRADLAVTFTATQSGRHTILVKAEGELHAELPVAISYVGDPELKAETVDPAD